MKIWLERGGNFYGEDGEVKFAIAYYKNAKQFGGFTIHIAFFSELVSINFMTNYKAYRAWIEQREEKRQRWRKRMGFPT